MNQPHLPARLATVGHRGSKRRHGAAAGARLSLLSFATLVACGSGLGELPTASSRRVDGVVAFRPIPATEALPSFAPLTLSFVGWEALTAAAPLDTLSAAEPVAPLDSTCAASGCPFVAAAVDTTAASKGAFALVASAGGATSPYVPTASLVLSPNQLADNKSNKVGMTAQGHASALTPTGVDRLAKLVDLTGAELLRRGFAIGVVAQSRVYPSGAVPGVAQALVSLVDTADGAQLFYPNDAWDAVQTNGTNAAGAFVVVGPPLPSASGAGTALSVAISPGTSLSHWPVQPVIVRPQMAVVMPLLPAP